VMQCWIFHHSALIIPRSQFLTSFPNPPWVSLSELPKIRFRQLPAVLCPNKMPAVMVTATIPSADGSTAPEDVVEIELKEPWIAALLAWMLPGLGHVYQGRTGKGLLFFICILGTFFYGMYLGGGKVVYASVPWEQQYRWQYLCQLGVGLPSTPMLVQKNRVMNKKEPLWSGFMAPPRRGPVDWKDSSGNYIEAA